ncbi:butyrophilin-like protein 2 [Acipenser oxyrinchus oxyrinchus]|uniref:Butyrophilin-like protein 2 n=1 Tax=Acipenser oxyrinchus oxyrinchus TaxID=40147 RepID=A0AAD8FRQ8_ACIOX|nr:butyrophilin-like protein 2 [Acipenser oxyrinchus oxyrinchus]
MKMRFLGRTCLIVLSLLPAVSTQNAWTVVGSDQPVIAEAGDDVILPCHISSRLSAVDMERGDISLHLRNLRPSDRGVYTCYADDGSQHDEGQAEVIVAALGTQPSISMDSTQGEQTRLVCRSEEVKHLNQTGNPNSTYPVIFPRSLWMDGGFLLDFSSQYWSHSSAGDPMEKNGCHGEKA